MFSNIENLKHYTILTKTDVCGWNHPSSTSRGGQKNRNRCEPNRTGSVFVFKPVRFSVNKKKTDWLSIRFSSDIKFWFDSVQFGYKILVRFGSNLSNKIKKKIIYLHIYTHLTLHIYTFNLKYI